MFHLQNLVVNNNIKKIYHKGDIPIDRKFCNC